MQANEAIEKLREELLNAIECAEQDGYEFGAARNLLAATATIDPPAAPVLAAVGVGARDWISVDERLPDDGVYVWAHWIGAGDWNDEPRSGQARRVCGGWQPMGNQGFDWNVTHWIPLPPAPAEPSSTAGAAKGGNTTPEVPAAQPAADHAKRAEGTHDAFMTWAMQFPGQPTQGDAFAAGADWQARGQQAGVPESACCNNNCNQGRNCPERK